MSKGGEKNVFKNDLRGDISNWENNSRGEGIGFPFYNSQGYCIGNERDPREVRMEFEMLSKRVQKEFEDVEKDSLRL